MPLSKSDQISEKQKWSVIIKPDFCKACGYCINFCPRKILVPSKNYNKKGYHYPEVTDESKCIGCRICEFMCPDFAIYIVPKKEE